ncbi:MAG: DNA-3-methyladenine glycosylase family protein [Halobacteriota archaeon]
MFERISQNRTSVSGTVSPIGPFDFALSLSFMSNGDPHIARYDNGRYWQVLRTNNRLVLATIRSIGLVAAPRLHVTLHSESILADDDIFAAICCLSSVLNVGLDVKPFYWAAKNDILMTKLINQLYGLKNITTVTVFEALICSIIEQQISLPVARSLEHKVTRAFGASMVACGARYYAFPTPQQLARASVDTVHSCGVSRQKAEYITEIAKTIEQGNMNIEKLKRCDDTPVILDFLCSLRGVGLWTAELTALRGLNRLDAMPTADVGLERRWIAHYYCSDQTVTSKHVRQIVAQWNKWKGLAGYYLITAGRLGVDA